MENNQITSIASGVFSGLGNLTFLYGVINRHVTDVILLCACRYLDNNRITLIASDSFNGLGRLNQLYVTTRNTLNDLSHEMLILGCRLINHNNITSIASMKFSGLGRLTLLYVAIYGHVPDVREILSNAGTCTTTRSHQLQVVRLLGLKT
jgi:hypothetical protein